jgi:hypothetical protein
LQTVPVRVEAADVGTRGSFVTHIEGRRILAEWEL